MEDSLDRECARLSRGARGTGLGGLRATALAHLTREPANREPGGGDRGARGDRHCHARRKKTPSRASSGRAPKWETRREARFPPASFRIGGPELPGASLGRPRANKGDGGRDATVNGHGAERLRDEGDGRARSKGIAGPNRRAGNRREHECSSGKRFRSAEVDRTHRGRDARGSLPRRPSDTRGLARTNHGPGHDAQSGGDSERTRCASSRSVF
jgi:hypothetical protein